LGKEALMLIINIAYKSLYLELKSYEELGVSMVMDGCTVSPLQIVQAHMIKEAGAYMRDYQINEKGGLEVLAFDEVNLVNDNI
jgi:hypothetical protein